MPDIKSIIQTEFKSLDIFLANFDFGMQEVQSDIFTQIIAALKKMPIIEGRFEKSANVKAILSRLEKKIYELIDSGQYNNELKKLVKNFDTIELVNKEISAYINPKDQAKVFEANTSNVRKAFIKDLSKKLGSKDIFGVSVVNPIKQILFQHSNQGMTVKSAASKLFQFAMGQEPGGGKLASYSGQVAHDAIYGFNGSVDKAIGDYIGAKDVNYIGNVIPDSRPQCVRWVVKFQGFIPGKQLQSEINWANKNGQGYGKNDPDLTIENFAEIRGGHRCRHIVKYSNGPASDKIKKIEAERRRQSDIFNRDAEKRLTGKTKILYEKQKKAVNLLVKEFGK